MSDPSRLSKLVLGILVAILANACAAGAQSTAPAGVSPQAIPSEDEAPLNAGSYTFDNSVLGFPGKPFPNIVISVPDGWTSFGYGVHRYNNTQRYLAVSFWNVADVYANGCQGFGPKIHPGPTADDLAAALAARPLRNATAPAAVSLGGYHGKYLEWSVPVDIHFSDCDASSFRSWTASNGGDRYQQGPGQVDRLWILDIEGSRLVIDVTYMPAASKLDQAELGKVADSIAFRP
jgi:hypothetical protein